MERKYAWTHDAWNGMDGVNEMIDPASPRLISRSFASLFFFFLRWGICGDVVIVSILMLVGVVCTLGWRRVGV